MFKKLTSWSLCLLILAAGTAAAEMKIAVLDTQRALLASEEAQSLLQQLQADLATDENELKTLRDEMVAIQEKLKTDGEVMSAPEQQKLQREFEDKQVDYQFLGNKLQKQVNDRRQELLQPMLTKIDAVLKDLIDLEGYDLIMERGSLLYVNSKHDITRRVTEKLNEKR